MSKENTKITGYVPAAIYQRLIEFQNNRGLTSVSQVLATALDYYLAAELSPNQDTEADNSRIKQLETHLTHHTDQLSYLNQQLLAIIERVEQLENVFHSLTQPTQSPESSPEFAELDNTLYASEDTAAIYPILAVHWPELLDALSAMEQRLAPASPLPLESEKLPEKETTQTPKSKSKRTQKKQKSQPSHQNNQLAKTSQSPQTYSPEGTIMTSREVTQFSQLTADRLNQSKQRGTLPLQVSVNGVFYEINYVQKGENSKNLWSVKPLSNPSPLVISAESSPDHSPTQSLSQIAISERLNVPRSTLRRKKNLLSASEFAEWTRAHDPDGIAWIYAEDSHNYQPVTQSAIAP